jgi:hypothetical protein
MRPTVLVALAFTITALSTFAVAAPVARSGVHERNQQRRNNKGTLRTGNGGQANGGSVDESITNDDGGLFDGSPTLLNFASRQCVRAMVL